MGQLPGWGSGQQRSRPRSTAQREHDSVGTCTTKASRAPEVSEEGGWTLVGAAATRRARPGAQRQSQSAAHGGEPCCAVTCDAGVGTAKPNPRRGTEVSNAEQAIVTRALAAVHQAMEEVTADGCASKVVAQLRAGWGHQRIERLVMLGLGPVSASAPARYQLALGLVLARELLGSGELPLVYDPVFDAEDVAMLDALKCRVIRQDEAKEAYADAPAGGHTLYFMPHCEQCLYDGVLDAFARLRALHRVALLGNSFAEYAERDDLRPADKRKREASALLQMQPLITETPLHTARSFPVSAFNSMALHLFSPANAADAMARVTIG